MSSPVETEEQDFDHIHHGDTMTKDGYVTDISDCKHSPMYKGVSCPGGKFEIMMKQPPIGCALCWVNLWKRSRHPSHSSA